MTQGLHNHNRFWFSTQTRETMVRYPCSITAKAFINKGEKNTKNTQKLHFSTGPHINRYREGKLSCFSRVAVSAVNSRKMSVWSFPTCPKAFHILLCSELIFVGCDSLLSLVRKASANLLRQYWGTKKKKDKTAQTHETPQRIPASAHIS